MIDPSKDKFAYFKDNIQTAEDKEEFDASQYYYHRDDFAKSAGASGSALAAGAALSGSFHGLGGLGVAGMDGEAHALPGGLSGFANAAMMGAGASSFVGGAGGGSRVLLGGGLPPTPELHRLGSNDHLAAVVKGRSFQSDNKAPDMSEFPALGSRMSALAIDANFDGGAGSRQTPPAEFMIQKEDFPALSTFADKSGATTPSAHELKRHGSFTVSSLDSTVSSTTPTRGATAIGQRGGPAASAVSTVSLSGGAFGHLRPTETPNSGAPGMDASNQFGLLGMLHTIIRPGNESKKNLAMGCDLTSLGLNLNSTEPLHPTFASPWADSPLSQEPQYTLPMCYYNQPPMLKTTHLSKFHLETLFYIFYSMPKDVLQAYAAQELYSREWRYHGELKLWLKRATAADTALLANSMSLASLGASAVAVPSSNTSVGSIGSGSGSTTTTTASTLAAGSSSPGSPQFLYFDTATWERRVFTGNIQSVSTGLLAEEDIRVKFNTSS